MNIHFSFRTLSGIWAAFILCTITMPANSADLSGPFPVATGQIETLGIQTTALDKKPDTVHATFPARITAPPSAEQIVSSAVTGMVTQILVQPYQLVHAGTPLLHIASPELGQLQLQLLQASAQATLAQQTAHREKLLFNDGIIPRNRIEQSQAILKAAEATLAQAKAALQLSGMNDSAIQQLLDTGKLQDNITLTASKAGVVTAIDVRPGQRIDAMSTLMTLVQTDSLWVDIQIPSSAQSQWKTGTTVKIADHEASAIILSASPIISPDNQSVLLRAKIQENDKNTLLRVGELVTVQLSLADAAQGWDVPLSALTYVDSQPYLFVRTPTGFDARNVTVKASTGQWAHVEGSLKHGDEIAVSRVIALKGAWLDNIKGDQ